MQCPRCASETGNDANRCLRCGTSLIRHRQAATERYGNVPVEIALRKADEEIKARESDRRLRRRWVRHGIIGSAIVIVLNIVFNLPFSILPPFVFVFLLGGALFGFPLGWLLSHQNAEGTRALAIGAAVGIAFASLASLIASGAIGWSTCIGGALSGLLPAYLVSMHIRLERH